MRTLRAILLGHPLLAVVIGLAGVMLRLSVPAGFMPILNHGQATLIPCSGYGAAPAAPGTRHHDREAPGSDNSCAFADFALPLIGAADAVQRAAAPIPILAAGAFVTAVPPARSGLRLRPPLRAPPLPA